MEPNTNYNNNPATAVLKEPASAVSSPWMVPELLAPAGDWDCARAAVENGADAIYFGLAQFNARMRANNFTEADLPRLIEYLHRRGVKGYVTFNTLVFANELAEAEQRLRTIIAAGVDAALVQDIGIARLIRRLSPDFPIHASTQMTITNSAGVEFARDLGCHRVVLARECSIKEIGLMQQARAEAAGAYLPPIEVFVHGALCVAYSGQCLTSEALGGRSANRGVCAQACRMPYDLVADGKLVPLGDRRYLLSPQDLAGLEVLPDLVRVGVCSLKIEGRLKTPEYVANITRVYRQALERVVNELKMAPTSESADRLALQLRTQASYDLEMAFSRGLYTGWLRGVNNQKLVHAHFGKKRGVYLGEVLRVQGDKILIDLVSALKPGDGVVFDAGKPEDPEEGGRVYTIEKHGRQTLLSFGRGDINFRRVHSGDKLWKTGDPELENRLRRSFSGAEPQYHRPIHLVVQGKVGEPLSVMARDESGHIAQVSSAMPLEAAANRPLTTDRLREQLGRLGGTAFTLGALENRLEGQGILPVSELNRIRREVVTELDRQRAQPQRWQLNPDEALADCLREVPAPTGPAIAPELIVMIRSSAQMEAALANDVRTLYCEFEDPKAYRQAVARFRAWQSEAAQRAGSTSIWVAPPRITKSGEEWMLKQVRSCDADGYLIRNHDHLRFFADVPRIGDFSINIANPITADYFIRQFGLSRLTASYDLNLDQLEALLRAAPPAWFEVTIHQHMPMFHMEHCLFCAFLSKGTDYTNCGRPCDKHDLKVRDRVGAEHPVKADAGCRNTVFNALAQTGAEGVARLLGLGLRHFRLEFLNETPEQVALTIRKYRQLLAGEITGTQLWRELKLLNQLGVTRGQVNKA